MSKAYDTQKAPLEQEGLSTMPVDRILPPYCKEL